MFRMSKIAKGAALVAASVLFMVGCGSSGTNNDQGVSFRAEGLFGPDSPGENVSTCKVGTSGIQMFLNSTILQNVPQRAGDWIKVENYMAEQFIRTERLECSYWIPGASVAIPDDAFPVSKVIPASPGALPAPGIDLPGGAATVTKAGAGDENVSYWCIWVPVVSADLEQYISNNQNYFPQTPFDMTATCHFVGVTQAGDVVETNDISINVWVDDFYPPSTEGGDPAGGDASSSSSSGELSSSSGT